MSATATNDVDPTIKKAIILLHSQSPTSATELRLMLDELIKQRYGPAKMLINTLGKKAFEWEKTFPGIQTAAPEQSAADEVINLTNSPTKTISDSPDTIPDSDDGAQLTMATSEEVENLKEFGDLNCCVCGEMMFTATNRLIECSQCGSLYHQECHKPAITNEETSDEQEHNWQCNNCNNKPSTSKAAAAAATTTAAVVAEEPISLIAKTKSSASSSRSSSSSNSSSPFYKQDHSSSSSTGKHHKSSSSSSKSTANKEDRALSSGSSTAAASKTPTVVTPAINVISAPEKVTPASSSKKSSSSHASSSKSSSSKSSSTTKHYESSGSSKRKQSK